MPKVIPRVFKRNCHDFPDTDEQQPKFNIPLTDARCVVRRITTLSRSVDFA
jgi:hypothetical protein